MLDEDVGRTQDPVEELVIWGEQWTMVGGRVRCNLCSKSQYPSDAGLQFIHEADCASANKSSFPWRDLKEVLSLGL